MKTKILDVPVDVITPEEALNRLLYYLSNENKRNHIIVTPNPEMVIRAKKDKEFMQIIKEADLAVPDGIGIVIASKLNKIKLRKRVTGCDLILSLFDNVQKDTTVYLLGAQPGVPEKAKENIELKYNNIKVVGIKNGYFDKKEENAIIDEIKKLKPNILLVGLGFPRQEKFIYMYKDELPVCISMGVGGSIDIMAGVVKRAPIIFRKLGMEWFYRVLCQPRRIFRIISLPVFVFKVIISKIFKVGKCN